MSIYQIISQTSNVLFETTAESFQDCIEQAVSCNINLDHAEFSISGYDGI